jgi:hypothetical protein
MNPWVGPTSFPRIAFLSLYMLGFRSGGATRLICGDPRFAQMLRCSARNRHAPQFHMDRYCSAEVTGPEAIMTMTLESMGRCAYGMHGDSISAPLHHHFAIQCRLMSGTLAHLSAPGYVKRAVWVQSVVPDGLPLAGEDKPGMEPRVRIHTPILLPFASISFVFCTSWFLHNLRPPPTAMAAELPPSRFK